MSYILDALRKADAERERGAVPGLHAQTVPMASGDEASRGPVKPFVWMGMGAAVVLAGALAWTMTSGDAPDEAAPPVAPVMSTAPVAPPPVAAAPAPMPAPIAAPVPAPAPAAKPAVKTAAAAKPARAERKPSSTALGAARPVASTAAPASERVYTVAELPENIRREMPALTIGGSIYSPTPASRFLIINGQIFHEGDKVANGLTLQEIKLKAAVLQYKGYRVGISY